MKPSAAGAIVWFLRERARRDRRIFTRHEDDAASIKKINRSPRPDFEALAVISRHISSILDPNELLQKILDTTARAVGATSGTLVLLRESSTRLKIVAARGISPEGVRGVRTTHRTGSHRLGGQTRRVGACGRRFEGRTIHSSFALGEV